MAENFSDIQRMKMKRSNNFMGKAKEIREIPIPKPVEVIEEVVEEAEVVTPVIPLADLEPDQGKLTISKGFIAGYTEDGKIMFKPFGDASRLELVGLVEYSKSISSDLLNELAGTKTAEIPAIKDGIHAILRGMQALLAQKESETAS